MKEDLSKQIVKISIPKLTYRFNRVPIKIPAGIFFSETDTLILKFILEFKGSQTAKTILKNKNKVGGLKLPDFKIYYKTIVIKTMSKNLNRHFTRDDIQIDNKYMKMCSTSLLMMELKPHASLKSQ